MTLQTPTCGQGEALSEPHRVDTAATKARIAQWCEWFALQPPKLKVRKGQIYLTPELTTWADAADISLDWLFMGDVRVMASAYRREREAERQSLALVRSFDAPEQRMLAAALKSVADGLVTNEDASAAFTAAVQERRAGQEGQL